MDPVLKPILDYGLIGLVLVLIMIGWLEAKPAIDERKTREKEKDVIIKGLTEALNQLADKYEAYVRK